MKRQQSFSLLMVVAMSTLACGFVLPSSSISTRTSTSQLWGSNMEEPEIKRQLEEYLEKRKELNADALAEQEKGKVIGGTKGNKILDYISGAPVKEQVLERIPNIFDYDELSKYGYGSLVTPIMDLGGRRAVYELMGLDAPTLPGPPPKKTAPKLVIDRKGENDKARYTGLKMGQVIDDDAMSEALERATKLAKEGKALRPKLMEEEYELPFADKRNVGPLQTPDWTPEKIDEYTKRQGEAISWARRAKEGEFIKDEGEILDLSLGLRFYCILTSFLLSFAFGRSTPVFLVSTSGIMDIDASSQFISVLQAPALALVLASIGSSVLCGVMMAPGKNRSSYVWAFKGLFGGPLAFLEMRELESLITRGEQEKQAKLS